MGIVDCWQKETEQGNRLQKHIFYYTKKAAYFAALVSPQGLEPWTH